MGTLKWIVGFLGWVSGGPIGALIGFLLGSFVEKGIDSFRLLTGGMDSGQEGGATYQQTTTGPRGYTATEQRNSFLVSLLVLSSSVIKADASSSRSSTTCVTSCAAVSAKPRCRRPCASWTA